MRSQNLTIDFRGKRNELWFPTPGLLERGLHIAPRRQRNHLKAIRIRLDDAKGAAADRAGGAQDGDTSHEKKLEWGAAGGWPTATRAKPHSTTASAPQRAARRPCPAYLRAREA